MGYYSNLAIEGTYHEDHSYPSPELQLKWRIEDLRSRLEDIVLSIGLPCRWPFLFFTDITNTYSQPEVQGPRIQIR